MCLVIGSSSEGGSLHGPISPAAWIDERPYFQGSGNFPLLSLSRRCLDWRVPYFNVGQTPRVAPVRPSRGQACTAPSTSCHYRLIVVPAWLVLSHVDHAGSRVGRPAHRGFLISRQLDRHACMGRSEMRRDVRVGPAIGNTTRLPRLPRDARWMDLRPKAETVQNLSKGAGDVCQAAAPLLTVQVNLGDGLGCGGRT